MPNADLYFEPCKIDEEQARTILNWRNDPTTLSMFYHRTPKVWDSFWQEYQREYFKDPSLPCGFVVDKNTGARVAFLKFGRTEDALAAKPTVDISINVSPEQRGKGYGSQSLKLAQKILWERGISSVIAEIRKENLASIASFASAGFKHLDERDKHIEDTGEVCRIVRYLAEKPTTRALLIDLDGTLADSLHTMRRAYEHFLNHFSRRGSDAEFQSLVGPPLNQVVQILHDNHRLPGDVNDNYKKFITFAAEIYTSVKLMPGAERALALARAQGWKICIVTANTSALIDSWLTSSGLRAKVDAVVTAESVSRGKPFPDAYLKALEVLGCSATAALAVEDSEMGAQAAVDAGLKTLVYAPSKQEKKWRGIEKTLFSYDQLDSYLLE